MLKAVAFLTDGVFIVVGIGVDLAALKIAGKTARRVRIHMAAVRKTDKATVIAWDKIWHSVNQLADLSDRKIG